MFYVYGLLDPINHDLRYVGKTDNLKLRLRDHINKKENNYKSNWIFHLKSLGLKPDMIILEEYENIIDCNDGEIFFIMYFKFLGSNLTNLTNGGDGWRKGMKHSAAAKKKISESHIGLKHTQETKNKLSELNTGFKHPQFGKPNISARKINDEDVKKIRDLYSSGKFTQTRIAEKFSISFQHVSDIVNFRKRKL